MTIQNFSSLSASGNDPLAALGLAQTNEAKSNELTQVAQPVLQKAVQQQAGDAAPEAEATAGSTDEDVVDAEFEEVKDDQK